MKNKFKIEAAAPANAVQLSSKGVDARAKIDMARRYQNRSLPTESLLNLIRREAPDFWRMAEVVGKWVWISFDDRQPCRITAALSELGFHWNNRRQAWQHPCGTVAASSNKDPRRIYRNYFPADMNPA